MLAPVPTITEENGRGDTPKGEKEEARDRPGDRMRRRAEQRQEEEEEGAREEESVPSICAPTTRDRH